MSNVRFYLLFNWSISKRQFCQGYCLLSNSACLVSVFLSFRFRCEHPENQHLPLSHGCNISQQSWQLEVCKITTKGSREVPRVITCIHHVITGRALGAQVRVALPSLPANEKGRPPADVDPPISPKSKSKDEIKHEIKEETQKLDCTS